MKRLLLLLLVLTGATITAQNTYQRGYFITNDGKRTECEIYNLAWKNNPTEFQYKFSEADDAKKMTIDEVKEFSVGNAYKYKRFTTQIERSSTDVNKLDRDPAPVWNTETLFLNVLVEGTLNLYKYEYGTMVKYFYSSGNHENAEQLLYKEYRQESSALKNNMYRQQLYNLMKDRIKTVSRFEKLAYKQQPLTGLFVEYNGEDVKENYTTRTNQGSLNVKFTPGGGISTLTAEHKARGNTLDFGSGVSFRAGLEIEYIMPFNNNKWSVFVDPHFAFYKDQGSNEDMSFSAKYRSLEVPAGVRHYFYVGANSRIFLDAVLSLDFPMGDTYITYNNVKLELDKTSHAGLGAGVAWGKFSAEARYNFGRGVLNNYQYWGSNYRRLDVIIGFRIF